MLLYICHMLLYSLPPQHSPLCLSLLTALHRKTVILAMRCYAVKVIKTKRTFPAACDSFIVMLNMFHWRMRPLAKVVCQETGQNTIDSLFFRERLSRLETSLGCDVALVWASR